MNLRKGYALLLVTMMVSTALVAFMSAPVVADTELRADWIELDYDPTTMLGEATYHIDSVDATFFCLGEGDGLNNDAATTCTVVMTVNIMDNDVDDLMLNISQYPDSAFDFNDPDTTTDQIEGVRGGPANPNAGQANTFTYVFDVLATSTLGAPTARDLTIRYWYWDETSLQERSDTLSGVKLYISSIFDNPANDPDEQLPNARDVSEVDTFFEAGDDFEATQVMLQNYEPAAGSDITDITCTVTEPGNGVTLAGGQNVCSIPGGITATNNDNLLYRTDVAVGTAPGVYSGSADVTYTRVDSGLPVTEAGLGVDWEVDFSFADDDPYMDGNAYSEFQCRATDVTITDDDLSDNTTRQVDVVAPWDTYEQSSFSDKLIEFEVVIENNGNTPIYNAEFVINPAAWPNFRNPQFFWTSAGTLAYDTIAVRNVDLLIGESVTFIIQVIVIKEIPIGEHRLPILYDGFYFDDGSLGNPTGFVEINGGNGIVDAADDLSIIFSIFVTDSYLDAAVTNVVMTGGALPDKTNIRAENIAVTIDNMEGYVFIDVVATADFTGTPFYAPLIDTTTGQPPIPTARDTMVDAQNANMATPFARWANGTAPGNQMVLNFLVDTDPDAVPDRYPFSITLTAIIEETLEVVTSTVTAGAEINFAGYGPQLVITAFTADDIVPGEHFTLDLTIENVGDDNARNCWVAIPVDGTAPPDVVNFMMTVGLFKLMQETNYTEISVSEMWGPGNNLNFSYDKEDMAITMEMLDLDSAKEIVELFLYIDGVYSNPGSTINFIKINDLGAGDIMQVTFDMIADKDMVGGKPYNIAVSITGINDIGGNVANVAGAGPYGGNGIVQTLEVMSSLPGDSYNPVELDWFDAGLKLLGLVLFFIIVLAILLWVYNKFKGEPGEEEDEDFDFEDEEPVSFEEPKKDDNTLVQP